jgi:hypothetical protein
VFRQERHGTCAVDLLIIQQSSAAPPVRGFGGTTIAKGDVMPDKAKLEARIRERAHKIWLDEGCPQGREQLHWELARLAIAEEDALASTLTPAQSPPPSAEPVEAVANQAEFPTLTDQGEAQHVPARKSAKAPARKPAKRRK